MLLRKLIRVAAAAAIFVGAGPILAAETEGGRRKLGSYTTDLCVSVIAIAGSPDRRYLEENDVDVDIFDDGEEFVCELGTGVTVPIKGTEEQMRRMRSMLDDGTLVSSESTVAVADDLVTVSGDDSVYLPPGEIVLLPRNDGRRRERRARRKMLKGGGGDAPDADDGDDDDDGRNLYERSFEGVKPILAVRVTDSRGRVHPDGADTISDKIFGTDDDPVNAKSQFAACSFGKLRVTNDYSVDISKHLSAPGVVDVTIPVSLEGNDRSAVRAELILATQAKLGLDLPGPFQHVMFVLERCYADCGWAAYAYVNSWLSIYQGDNYKYVSVQMHELGHNLNMAHSGGLDGKTYTDHSCLMGNPYYDDDEGVMCYNPAKNFQIARADQSWYSENNYDTRVWNTGTVGGTKWSGTIVGVADYENNPDSRPVVVKIESGRPDDLFVGFNRARGVNRDVADARDTVTVVEAGNDGLGYSQSFLRATLSEGQSYRVGNWRGSGLDMTIYVREINLSADPGYADVRMSFGDAQTNPTTAATPNPTTRRPTRRPTPNPVTPAPTDKPTEKPPVSSCGNSICDADENSSACPVDCLGREIETTFDFNLGSGGNMFAVEAKRTVAISSFAINSSSRGAGRVRVYTREGSYAGHVTSDEGWDLIYDEPDVTHARRGHRTELGEFAEAVIVAGGTRRSFFVTSERGLVYQSGTEEDSPYASDESVSILEGIGTDDAFSATVYSPRVWGGRMRYNVVDTTAEPTASPTTSSCGDDECSMNEDAASCPSDCADRALETTFEFSLGSSGNMFEVKALRDVSISSFDINAMSRGVGSVRVYTRSGSYVGYEQDNEGWDLVYDDPAVSHNRRGQSTALGEFDDVVRMERGDVRSFFVTSTKKLVYVMGTEEGTPYASDGSLVIYEGVGTTDVFAGVPYSPRVFGGVIRYDAHRTTTGSCGDSACSADEDASSCPSDCAGRELETTFDFDLGSGGNMFTVRALRDVSVSSLVINAMSWGEGAVRVYTRAGSYVDHRRSVAGWEMIHNNSSVIHNRRGRPTEVGDFEDVVSIPGGATRSFFVTSTKKLVYKLGTEEGAPFASDGSMVIYEGVGTTDDFAGVTYSPRVFGGIIRYDID